MLKEERRPELIVIAGPNGSGKTSVTQKFLHLEDYFTIYKVNRELRDYSSDG